MGCYHPLKAMVVGETLNGRKQLKFMSGYSDGIWLLTHAQLPPEGSILDVPCGKCIGCRLDYARDWANRCEIESRYWTSNLFLTLTYVDDHLHWNSTGNIATLCKRDLQLFFKRLRKNFPDFSFRYYAAGEYGDSSLRPHYHVCLFSDWFPDDSLHWNSTHDGYELLRSPVLDRIWSHGMVIFSQFSWQTANYVSRYCLKKQKGVTAAVYQRAGIEPEFSVSSRRPGIGGFGYDPALYEQDSIQLSDGRLIRPPKYYDRLLSIDNPDFLQYIKEKRSVSASAIGTAKDMLSGLTHDEVLIIEERVKQKQALILLRSDVL